MIVPLRLASLCWQKTHIPELLDPTGGDTVFNTHTLYSNTYTHTHMHIYTHTPTYTHKKTHENTTQTQTDTHIDRVMRAVMQCRAFHGVVVLSL